MRRIYLIRHGQPAFPGGKKHCIGITDFPLSTLGRLQACQMAETFAGMELPLFTSPLIRAFDTAAFISGDPIVIPEIHEQHMGLWEGLSFEEIRLRFPQMYEARGGNPYLDVPGSESIESMAARFALGLEKALSRSEGDIIVVAHCAVILSFICKIVGSEKFFLPENKQSYTGRYVLEYDNGIFTVRLPHTRPIPALDRRLCTKLLQAAKLPEHIIAHCRAVAEEAERIALALAQAGQELDTELIFRAALLHDLARPENEHPITAARWLNDLCYDKEADIIRQHHDPDSEQINEAAVVYIADKLIRETKKVSLKERFDSSRTKCESAGALAAHARREAQAMAIKEKINSLCGKEIII